MIDVFTAVSGRHEFRRAAQRADPALYRPSAQRETDTSQEAERSDRGTNDRSSPRQDPRHHLPRRTHRGQRRLAGTSTGTTQA